MRWVLSSLMVLALASPALADDLGILRGTETAVPTVVPPTITVGPATFTRWSGFYLGGRWDKYRLSGATAPLVSFSLRNTTLENDQSPSQYQVLGRSSGDGFGGGGFIGYHTQ